MNNDEFQLNCMLHKSVYILLLMSLSVVHCIMELGFIGAWEESYT